LDAVERAVRAALDKGNASDKAFRVKIYASAQTALERSLAARALQQHELEARRRHLASVIATIEMDFMPAVPAESTFADAPFFDQFSPEIAPVVVADKGLRPPAPVEPPLEPARVDRVPVGEARREPVLGPEDVPVQAAAVRLDEMHEPLGGNGLAPSAAGNADPKPPKARWQWLNASRVSEVDGHAPIDDKLPSSKKSGSKRKRSSRYRAISLALNGAFLLALVLGGLWAYDWGMRFYNDETSNRPRATAPALSEQGGENDAAAANASVVGIFSPQNAELLTVPAGAEAQLSSRDGIDVLVLKGGSASQPITIGVGEGVLSSFAGKRVLFSLRARSAGETPVEIAVNCDFAALADCERKRFTVTPAIGEYLFAVTLAKGGAVSNGVLTLEPDVSGGGAAVELLNVAIAPVEP
jgi:hypothetical protein